MENLKILEVGSELAAGTRGASLGIGAIKTASLNRNSDFFRRFPTQEVPTINDTLFEDVQNPYAKHIVGVRKMLERTSDAVKAVASENIFPVILGGDHSTAAGTICGIKAANPDKRLGVIWIDAHGDLHSPFTSPSGNMHGMPLGMTANEDNLDCKVNDPKEQTLEEWARIKDIGVKGPKIKLEDIVFIGVRDTEAPEEYLMKKHGIRNIQVAEVREKGVEWAAEEALQRLAECDIIYISFDVDSMDPSISWGTGTPVPGGLTLEEAIALNKRLVEEPRVRCWEIVEVNPTLDSENKMGDAAFQVLESTVTHRQQLKGLAPA